MCLHFWLLLFLHLHLLLVMVFCFLFGHKFIFSNAEEKIVWNQMMQKNVCKKLINVDEWHFFFFSFICQIGYCNSRLVLWKCHKRKQISHKVKRKRDRGREREHGGQTCERAVIITKHAVKHICVYVCVYAIYMFHLTLTGVYDSSVLNGGLNIYIQLH